jgi:hypothetical protein
MVDVNLNVNSNVGMKFSRIHDAKMIFHGPNKFIPSLDINSKIMHISAQSEKKRAMKKDGKFKKDNGKMCQNGQGNITDVGFVINLLDLDPNEGRLDFEKDK